MLMMTDRHTRVRRPSPIAALAISAALLSLCIAPEPVRAADCVTSAASINFCKRCTTVIPVSTGHDLACTGYPPRGARSSNEQTIVVLGAKLEKRPQHGTASVSGQSWTYSPAKGFSGHDTFTIERDYLQGGNQLYVLYFQFEMDVH
jgi:hypothetical protein